MTDLQALSGLYGTLHVINLIINAVLKSQMSHMDNWSIFPPCYKYISLYTMPYQNDVCVIYTDIVKQTCVP